MIIQKQAPLSCLVVSFLLHSHHTAVNAAQPLDLSRHLLQATCTDPIMDSSCNCPHSLMTVVDGLCTCPIHSTITGTNCVANPGYTTSYGPAPKQVFTTTSSWTVPAGTTNVFFQMWGAGGATNTYGGVSATSSNNGQGGGIGGTGGYSDCMMSPQSGSTFNVKVGVSGKIVSSVVLGGGSSSIVSGSTVLVAAGGGGGSGGYGMYVVPPGGGGCYLSGSTNGGSGGGTSPSVCVMTITGAPNGKTCPLAIGTHVQGNAGVTDPVCGSPIDNVPYGNWVGGGAGCNAGSSNPSWGGLAIGGGGGAGYVSNTCTSGVTLASAQDALTPPYTQKYPTGYSQNMYGSPDRNGLVSVQYCPPGLSVYTMGSDGTMSCSTLSSCPVNYYCPGDGTSVKCQGNLQSPAESTSADACTCPTNALRVSDYTCECSDGFMQVNSTTVPGLYTCVACDASKLVGF